MRTKSLFALALSVGLTCSLPCHAEDYGIDLSLGEQGLFGSDMYAGLNSSDSSWMGNQSSEKGRRPPPGGHGGGFQGFALGDGGYQLFQLNLGMGHPPGPPPQEATSSDTSTTSDSSYTTISSTYSISTSYQSSQQGQRRPPKGGMFMLGDQHYRLVNVEFSSSGSGEPPQLEPGSQPQVVATFRADVVVMTPPTSTTSTSSYSTYTGYSTSEDTSTTSETTAGTIEGSIVAHAPPARPEGSSETSYQTSTTSYSSSNAQEQGRPPHPPGRMVLEGQVQLDAGNFQLLGLAGPGGPGGRGGPGGPGKGRRGGNGQNQWEQSSQE